MEITISFCVNFILVFKLAILVLTLVFHLTLIFMLFISVVSSFRERYLYVSAI